MGKNSSGMKIGIRYARNMIANRDFGKMVVLRNNEIVSVPLAYVSGKLKLVEPDDPRVIQAQNLGTSFGV